MVRKIFFVFHASKICHIAQPIINFMQGIVIIILFGFLLFRSILKEKSGCNLGLCMVLQLDYYHCVARPTLSQQFDRSECQWDLSIVPTVFLRTSSYLALLLKLRRSKSRLEFGRKERRVVHTKESG